MVWIDMHPADNENAAHRQAEQLISPRIAHFHDPVQRAGKAFAEAMGARGRVSWDIYLVFQPDVQWAETAPHPHAWVHQLAGALWANPFRFRTGKALKCELSKMLMENFQPELKYSGEFK